MWIELLEMRLPWYLPVLEHQDNLDQTGDPRCSLGMANVRLDRAEMAERIIGRFADKQRTEGIQFDRIAQWCAGAVSAASTVGSPPLPDRPV